MIDFEEDVFIIKLNEVKKNGLMHHYQHHPHQQNQKLN